MTFGAFMDALATPDEFNGVPALYPVPSPAEPLPGIHRSPILESAERLSQTRAAYSD